jgi:hypothetical protein
MDSATCSVTCRSCAITARSLRGLAQRVRTNPIGLGFPQSQSCNQTERWVGADLNACIMLLGVHMRAWPHEQGYKSAGCIPEPKAMEPPRSSREARPTSASRRGLAMRAGEFRAAARGTSAQRNGIVQAHLRVPAIPKEALEQLRCSSSRRSQGSGSSLPRAQGVVREGGLEPPHHGHWYLKPGANNDIRQLTAVSSTPPPKHETYCAMCAPRNLGM